MAGGGSDDAAMAAYIAVKQLAERGSAEAEAAAAAYRNKQVSAADFVTIASALLEGLEPVRGPPSSARGADGFLFMCSGKTFGEVVRRSLFGTGTDRRPLVEKHVTPSTRLFLFNFSRRTIYGVFWAAAPPAINIEPDAWQGNSTRQRRSDRREGDSTTPYPLQVRVCRTAGERLRGWKLPDDLILKEGVIPAGVMEQQVGRA